jgi:hypothetical protein
MAWPLFSAPQTFISATLGSVVSLALFRGVYGSPYPLDFTDAFLTGAKVGASFIAYPVAVKVLKQNCAAFKQRAEDPSACKASIYALGGALGGAIVTAVHYPISTVLDQRRGKGWKAPVISLSGAAGFYIDQIGRSIGFAATMGTLTPMVPLASNSLLV